MNIEKVEVNWQERYANMPKLTVWVDDVPKWEDVEHEVIEVRQGAIMYLGYREDGFTHFFVSTSDKSGYYGREFVIPVKGMGEVSVKGPWSSGSYAVNEVYTDEQFLDVTYKIPDHITPVGGAITKSVVEQHLPDNIELVRSTKMGVRYIPQWNGKGKRPDSKKAEILKEQE